jgi:putative transposase
VVPESSATSSPTDCADTSRAPGDKWHLDDVFITIGAKIHYLWRAVDQHGNVPDILATSRRDAKAATRFFPTLLQKLRYVPRVLLTDTLGCYGVAQQRLTPGEHRRSKYLNNRGRELSPTDPPA